MSKFKNKIVCIAGWSGSGKTTLVEELIKIFKTKYKLSVCALKHAHKNFEIDKKGKDSFRFNKAGADQIIISSIKQWVLIKKVTENEEELANLLKLTSNYNITLVEGWKYSKIKKIEVYREILKKEVLCKNDRNILAIATNSKNINIPKNVKMLSLNNCLRIADFILKNNFSIDYD